MCPRCMHAYVCMCVCMCIYIYIYIYMYINTYTHIYFFAWSFQCSCDIGKITKTPLVLRHLPSPILWTLGTAKSLRRFVAAHVWFVWNYTQFKNREFFKSIRTGPKHKVHFSHRNMNVAWFMTAIQINGESLVCNSIFAAHIYGDRPQNISFKRSMGHDICRWRVRIYEKHPRSLC